MTINQSAMQELGQAHKLYLLTPPQIHKVYQSRLSLYNQELIIQFFQSEVSSLLRREPLKEYVKEFIINFFIFLINFIFFIGDY